MLSLVKKVQASLPGYHVSAIHSARGPCVEAVKGNHVALFSATCIRNEPGILSTVARTPTLPGEVREWKRGRLVIAVDHLQC
jgi:hypothetical protein